MGIHKTIKAYGHEDRIRWHSKQGLKDTWSIARIWTSARVLMYPTHSARYTLVALVLTVLICLLLSVSVLALLTVLAAVYIGMELLGNFAQSRRRSFEGSRFHDFEKLEHSQRTLVYKRKLLWAQRLLASYLGTELDKRRYLQFVVGEGQWGSPPYEYVRIIEFKKWSRTRIRELEDYASCAEAIMNKGISISAWGRGNTVDQVENVVAAVDMLVELWEGVAKWILRCRSVLVHDRMKELPHGLSVLGIDMFNTLSDLPSDLTSELEEAIEELGQYGGECNITVSFNANAEEFSRATQDVLSSGGLEEAILSEL